eukprot:scaffold48_cov311-Pinguiococcus_pyrenoidosus.AAC.30
MAAIGSSPRRCTDERPSAPPPPAPRSLPLLPGAIRWRYSRPRAFPPLQKSYCRHATTALRSAVAGHRAVAGFYGLEEPALEAAFRVSPPRRAPSSPLGLWPAAERAPCQRGRRSPARGPHRAVRLRRKSAGEEELASPRRPRASPEGARGRPAASCSSENGSKEKNKRNGDPTQLKMHRRCADRCRTSDRRVVGGRAAGQHRAAAAAGEGAAGAAAADSGGPGAPVEKVCAGKKAS